MYKTLIIPIFIILSTMLLACTETLVDIPGDKEIVNGFNVTWRSNVTDKQKDAIREILNDMQFVEGGTFLMGATQEQGPYARDNEKPAHYVQLSDFYIGKNEISIQNLEALLDKEFSVYERDHGAPKYTWSDWKMILNLFDDYSGVELDFPTEAQWEYAARGGNKCKGFIFPGGNSISSIDNCENELGLVGMARGHSEWCKDAFNEYSGRPLEVNPYYVQGLGHIIRGGNEKSVGELKDYYSSYSSKDKFFSVYNDIRNCRVSARSYADDSHADMGIYISCRFVINPKQQ